MKEIFNLIGFNITFYILCIIISNVLTNILETNNTLEVIPIYLCTSISSLWICIYTYVININI